ncbi:MAG: hypothetical protein IH614_06580 [Desulfuromonadales bacterium]|nr:hypothetical protein [Desulfuromonadales bacterium]
MKTDRLGNERGATIVLALLVLLILSLLGVSALSISLTEVKIVRNQEAAAQAFFLAEAGIQRAAGVFNRQGFGAVQSLANQEHSLGPGSYRLLVASLTPDQRRIRITSTGRCLGASRQLQAEFSRAMVLPPPEGAVHVFGAAPTIRLGDGAVIDGRDHALPVGFPCTGDDCLLTLASGPPLAGLYSSDSATLAGAEPVGDPAARAGGGDSSAETWRSLAAGLTREAAVNPADLGSRSQPKIARITGEHTLSGATAGAGILIIDQGGRLQLTDDFHYEGLIIVLDGAGEDLFAGNGTLFGSLVLVGENIEADFGRQSQLRYSSQALASLDDLLPATGNNRLTNWCDLTYLTELGL